MYEDYYTGQVGGNMPMFRCVRYQRGHGLANVISGLFRRVVLPFLKKEQKDVYQKCVQNWNGSGRRCTGRRISEIVCEEALTARHKMHCWRREFANGLLKEMEDEKKTRRAIIENDGIRTRAFL